MERLVNTIAEYPVYFSDYSNYVLILLLLIILALNWRISKSQIDKKKKITLRILFVVFVLGLSSLIFITNFPLKPMINALSTVDKSIGASMVDIEYINVRNGKIENVNDYKEKIVVLNFWGTFCAPCVKEFPDLKKLEVAFSDDLVVIAISNESPAKIEAFITRIESPSIVGSQKNNEWINPENFLPLTVIIKNGIVEQRIFGRKSYEEFVEIIAEYVAVR
jgi:thiol-disulfide isomerase/thioredoxin